MTSLQTQQDIIVGVFTSESSAQQAVAQLRADGFAENDIHVVADQDHQRNEPGDVSDNTVTRSTSGLWVGALIGAVCGLLVGVVLGSGLVPLPSLLSGVGPVGNILIFAFIGAALGMLGGSMAGMTQARQETKGLEKAVEAGYWLVSLANVDTNAARAALGKVGALDLRVQTPKHETVQRKA